MAQTKRKRKRKHRGTQGGSIDRRRRTRPRTREEARAQARQASKRGKGGKTVNRRDRPPTWRSAFNRALLMSVILFALMAFAFGRDVGGSAVLALTMLLIYVPAGYYLERFLFRRRKAIEHRARAKQAQKAKG